MDDPAPLLISTTQTYQLWFALACVALLLSKFVASLSRKRRLLSSMPPGPAGLPFLGNILQMSRHQWIQLTEWKEQYGSIFSLNLLGQPTVVVNDLTTVADLLDRRSNTYSGRPRFIMAGEIMTGNLFFILQSGDRWRRMRRATHEGLLNTQAVLSYQPIQEKQAAVLALHMLDDPSNWDSHYRRSSASTILSVVYGWPPVDPSRDSIVEEVHKLAFRVAHAIRPGTYMVESLPWMLYLPEWLARWKREGRALFRYGTKLFQRLKDEVEMQMKLGEMDSSSCFAARLMDGKSDLSEQEIVWLAGTMFGAGAESTSAVHVCFTLAMTLYQDVMRRAQDQIDRVVGRARLPNFGDRDQLPYVEALVKEVLRWRPVFPLAAPRYTTEDDNYKGYFIPKGTLIIYNVWGMHRDPAYFPDFDEFRPERYLDASGYLADPIPDTHGQGHLSFGTGRRICAGKELATSSLFMNIATMLWAFDIEYALDEKGNHIVPSCDEWIDEGLILRPAPFECVIKPRSTETATLIRSRVEDRLS